MEEDLEHFPMPDGLYRFGDETPIPGRLKIITKGDGESEELVKVVREKRKGQPKGTTEEAKLDCMSILEERTPPHLVETATSPVYSNKSAHIPTTSKVTLGTSSRPEVFLLVILSTDISVSNLPKTGPVPLSPGEWTWQEGSSTENCRKFEGNLAASFWA